MTVMVDGQVVMLANQVARLLGRKVTVHHDRFQFRVPGGKVKWSPWKYTILFEGVPIPFAGLTVNEAKGRLAMLSDLYYAKVFDDADSTKPRADRQGSTGPGTGGAASQPPGAAGAPQPDASGSGGAIDKLGDDDDRY